ncbi:MAG: hypothetical protein IPM82_11910 [Saprospiraceae bacterium]|nr:hypothetical protein [Saprospiraceae bacterium]
MKWLFKELNNAEDSIRTTVENFQPTNHNTADPPYSISFLGKPSYRLGVIFGEVNDPLASICCLNYWRVNSMRNTCGVHYPGELRQIFGTERTAHQWRATGLELAQKLNGTWYNDQRMSDILSNWQNDIVLYHNAASVGWKNLIRQVFFTKAKVEGNRQE